MKKLIEFIKAKLEVAKRRQRRNREREIRGQINVCTRNGKLYIVCNGVATFEYRESDSVIDVLRDVETARETAVNFAKDKNEL